MTTAVHYSATQVDRMYDRPGYFATYFPTSRGQRCGRHAALDQHYATLVVSATHVSLIVATVVFVIGHVLGTMVLGSRFCTPFGSRPWQQF